MSTAASPTPAIPAQSSSATAWVLALILAFAGGSYLGSDCPPAPVVPAVDPVEPTVEPGKLTISVAGEKTVAPGASVELIAKGNAKRVHWSSAAQFRGPYENGTVIVFSTPTPGVYVFTLAGDDEDELTQVRHELTVGQPVPPDPTPPTPTPIPPNPTPPQPVGPLVISIIYETSEATPEMARTFLNLRTGAAAAYLKGKGHTLNVLDDDLTDATGKPSPLVTRWAPLGKVPELVIGTAQAKVLWRGPLPATADAVIEQIKRAGG